MRELSCGGNLLNTLDVRYNSNLAKLACECNFLRSLDLSQNHNLKNLSIYLNQIRLSEMTDLVNQLPTLYDKGYGSMPVVFSKKDEFNFMSKELVHLAKSKGWRPIERSTILEYGGRDADLEYTDSEQIIEMTTVREIGKTIDMAIFARGSVTIEGVREQHQSKYEKGSLNRLFSEKRTYTITDQTIRIKGSVYALNVEKNDLISLDVTRCKGLDVLRCSANKLRELDVRNNISLIGLHCDRNQLQHVDVSKNLYLVALDVSYSHYGELSQLDVTANKELRVLTCSDNKLRTLDLSNNEDLSFLYCHRNQLKSLDLSQTNKQLSLLYMDVNQIGFDAMGRIVESLPDRNGKSGDNLFFVVDKSSKIERNRITTAMATIAKSKGWKVRDHNNSTGINGEWDWKGIPYDGEDDEPSGEPESCPNDPEAAYYVSSIRPGEYLPANHGEIYCSNGNYTSYANGELTAKISVTSDNEVCVTVKTLHSHNSFEYSGTGYIKELDPCGPVVAGTETPYSRGDESFVTRFRPNFRSGSRTYVVMIKTNEGWRYHTRPFTITARGEQPKTSPIEIEYLYPKNGDSDVPTDVTLQWRIKGLGSATALRSASSPNSPSTPLLTATPSPKNVVFRVYLGKSRNKLYYFGEVNGLSDVSSFDLRGKQAFIEPNTTYYWRVEAEVDGVKHVIEPHSFTTSAVGIDKESLKILEREGGLDKLRLYKLGWDKKENKLHLRLAGESSSDEIDWSPVRGILQNKLALRVKCNDQYIQVLDAPSRNLGGKSSFLDIYVTPTRVGRNHFSVDFDSHTMKKGRRTISTNEVSFDAQERHLDVRLQKQAKSMGGLIVIAGYSFSQTSNKSVRVRGAEVKFKTNDGHIFEGVTNENGICLLANIPVGTKGILEVKKYGHKFQPESQRISMEKPEEQVKRFTATLSDGYIETDISAIEYKSVKLKHSAITIRCEAKEDFNGKIYLVKNNRIVGVSEGVSMVKSSQEEIEMKIDETYYPEEDDKMDAYRLYSQQRSELGDYEPKMLLANQQGFKLEREWLLESKVIDLYKVYVEVMQEINRIKYIEQQIKDYAGFRPSNIMPRRWKKYWSPIDYLNEEFENALDKLVPNGKSIKKLTEEILELRSLVEFESMDPSQWGLKADTPEEIVSWTKFAGKLLLLAQSNPMASVVFRTYTKLMESAVKLIKVSANRGNHGHLSAAKFRPQVIIDIRGKSDWFGLGNDQYDFTTSDFLKDSPIKEVYIHSSGSAKKRCTPYASLEEFEKDTKLVGEGFELDRMFQYKPKNSWLTFSFEHSGGAPSFTFIEIIWANNMVTMIPFDPDKVSYEHQMGFGVRIQTNSKISDIRRMLLYPTVENSENSNFYTKWKKYW